MVLLKNDGEQVQIREASAMPDNVNDYERSVLDVLLIGGEPLNVPVARYGPFVMNTQDEIYKAIEDYRSGKMRVVNPNIEISKARLH